MDTFDMSDGSGIQLLSFYKDRDEVVFSEPALIIFARLRGKAREAAREVLGDEFFGRLEKAAGAEHLKWRAAIDEQRRLAKSDTWVNSSVLEDLQNAALPLFSAERVEAEREVVLNLSRNVSKLARDIKQMTLPIEAAGKKVLEVGLAELQRTLATKLREARFGRFKSLPVEVLRQRDLQGYPRFALLPLDGAVFRVALSGSWGYGACRWAWHVIGNKDGYESDGEYYPRSNPSDTYRAIVETYYLDFFGKVLSEKEKDIRAAAEAPRRFYLTTGVSATLSSSLRSLIREAKLQFDELFFLVPANWADEKTTDRMVYFAEGKGVCVGWDGEQFVVLGDFPLTPTERYI